MTLQQRYQQAAREARWALGLTIAYMIGWCVCLFARYEYRSIRLSPLVRIVLYLFASIIYCGGLLVN